MLNDLAKLKSSSMSVCRMIVDKSEYNLDLITKLY